TFHTDPAEAASTHQFFDCGSSFTTEFLPPRFVDRFLRRTEEFMMWILGHEEVGVYQHHHVFPNLLISRTDSASFIQMVHPTGPTTSFSLIWQYARSSRRRNVFSRIVAYTWGQFTAGLSKNIIKEDYSVFALVQAGAAGA